MKKLNTALLAAGIVCAEFISITYAATCPQPDAITITKSDQGYLYSAPGWKNARPHTRKLEINNFFSVTYLPDFPNAESGKINRCVYQLKSENEKLLPLLILSNEKKVLKPTGEEWELLPVKSKTMLCKGKAESVERCTFEFIPIADTCPAIDTIQK